MTNLDPYQVELVLDRLGLSSHPDINLSGLAQLYEAWCRQVPFDNIRKLIAVRSGLSTPLPGDDPGEFFDAWLQHGVGGTCWAGNGALCELLTALGYRANRGLATMMVAPNLPPNHGTVVVELPQGSYLVDASILFVEPLLVAGGMETEVAHAAWGVKGRWFDDKYVVEWRALRRPEPIQCRIDKWPVETSQFREQHETTRVWSPFNYELTFELVRDERRIGVSHGQAVSLADDGSLLSSSLTDRAGYLVDELGISEELAVQIPDDIRTPPPPGSQAEAASSPTS